MFIVAVSTPNIGKPMERSFKTPDTAEQYILNIAQGMAEKVLDGGDFKREVEANKDDTNMLMALLARLDVDVVYYEPEA